MAGFRRFQHQYLPFLPEAKKFRHLRDRLLRGIGLARARDPELLAEHPQLRYGSVLPLVVAQHVLQHGELSILQIGAYDGSVGDEILGLIERYPVRGILVEPQPSAFARLHELHKDNEQLLLINAAIDRQTGKRPFYMAAQGDVEFASFDKQHLMSHGLHSQEIFAHTVDCLTIDDVLRLANLDSIDLLQIDAEGHDYEIIKSIDFDRVAPQILRFEFRHFSKQDLHACLQMLASRGYRFLTEELDVIAVQSGPKREPTSAAWKAPLPRSRFAPARRLQMKPQARVF